MGWLAPLAWEPLSAARPRPNQEPFPPGGMTWEDSRAGVWTPALPGTHLPLFQKGPALRSQGSVRSGLFRVRYTFDLGWISLLIPQEASLKLERKAELLRNSETKQPKIAERC